MEIDRDQFKYITYRVQLALISLDSNSNVDDGFVFADCRRNITSGLTQVASFMLIARNVAIVMS